MDFCGLYDPETAIFNLVTAKSCTGYSVLYIVCPIIWASKLWAKTALLRTEAKYNSCYKALCNVTPFVDILKKAKALGTEEGPPNSKIYCKLSCNNSGACKLIRLPTLTQNSITSGNTWPRELSLLNKSTLSISWPISPPSLFLFHCFQVLPSFIRVVTHQTSDERGWDFSSFTVLVPYLIQSCLPHSFRFHNSHLNCQSEVNLCTNLHVSHTILKW